MSQTINTVGVPDWQADLRGLVDRWAQPPAEFVGKLPKAGVKLDYLGHAAVTRALLEADLGWTWEPVAVTDAGEPLIVVRDGTARMWIRLTVCGVTRLGVGTCPASTFDVEKQLVGDALRNAAMRFGVALSLWSKEPWEAHDDPEPEPVKPSARAKHDREVADKADKAARGRQIPERELSQPTRTVPGPDQLADVDPVLETARAGLQARRRSIAADKPQLRTALNAFIQSIGAPNETAKMNLGQVESCQAFLDEQETAA